MLKRGVLIWIISWYAATAFSQILTVRSSFGSDSAMIGEQLDYTITAETRPGVEVTLPEYTDTITAQIEIIETYPADTVSAGNKKTVSRKYRVTSFAPGWNTIPPQPVSFRAGEFTDTVYTTANLLTVLTPEVDPESDIRPIKPPVNTPLNFAEIFPWLLIGVGGFLLITLVWALIWIWRQKTKDPEQFEQAPSEPAHVIAFRDLEALKNQKLPENGMVKEYYSRLTEVIRQYMTRQFGIHAMESTTLEILEAFSVQNTGSEELNKKLENLLMLADLVKFAKEDPTPVENTTHMRSAVGFVEQTYRMFYDEEEADESDQNVAPSENLTVKQEVDHG